MADWPVTNREEFLAALEQAQAGDCIQIEALANVAGTGRELLHAMLKLQDRELDLVSLREEIDTRSEGGRILFPFSRALLALDREDRREQQRKGIDRAREEGKYRGRKPIAVDESLFDSVVALWKSGSITAREAMTRLNLKPNTFYRRMKEQEDNKMKEYKKIEKEIRSEIRDAAKQSRQNLDDLKKQVRAEAKEVKQASSEKLELHDVEREIRRERRKAEAEHQDSIRQMKKDVEAEAKELKKLTQEQ